MVPAATEEVNTPEPTKSETDLAPKRKPGRPRKILKEVKPAPKEDRSSKSGKRINIEKCFAPLEKLSLQRNKELAIAEKQFEEAQDKAMLTEDQAWILQGSDKPEIQKKVTEFKINATPDTYNFETDSSGRTIVSDGTTTSYIRDHCDESGDVHRHTTLRGLFNGLDMRLFKSKFIDSLAKRIQQGIATDYNKDIETMTDREIAFGIFATRSNRMNDKKVDIEAVIKLKAKNHDYRIMICYDHEARAQYYFEAIQAALDDSERVLHMVLLETLARSEIIMTGDADLCQNMHDNFELFLRSLSGDHLHSLERIEKYANTHFWNFPALCRRLQCEIDACKSEIKDRVKFMRLHAQFESIDDSQW